MKYLGVDFGLKRVGLATSEGIIASPFKVLEVKSLKDAVLKVEGIIQDGLFDKVVIGMPEGRIGQSVRSFINKLKKSGIDIVETDETLSTQEAQKQMIELNISKKKRRINDDMAAAIILQNYLDEKI